MERRSIVLVLLAAVILGLAGVGGYQLAESGHWTFALLRGLGIPLVTFSEWLAAQQRGAAAGEVADRMLVVVMLALGATL